MAASAIVDGFISTFPVNSSDTECIHKQFLKKKTEITDLRATNISRNL